MPGVCEAESFSSVGGDLSAPPDLLIEVPHGATRRRDFDETRRRLRGEYPADLEEFFFVNTDVGAPECAFRLARSFVDPRSQPGLVEMAGLSASEIDRPRKVRVVRSLLPRTFVDCNRVVGPTKVSGSRLTPAVPEYVTDSGDVRLLERRHRAYQKLAASAYKLVCDPGGTALTLHTYAPRSVPIERLDGSIVDNLRAAYRPERYENWPHRPAVDVISEGDDGRFLAPRALVASIIDLYEQAGVRARQNATYRLHEGTTGYLHASRYAGQVLCLEIRRDLLADPFDPFSEMRIGEAKVRKMTLPLAAALLRHTARTGDDVAKKVDEKV
jgi:hypothetical protein